MLFCDIAMAARIERAECRLTTDISDAIRFGGRDSFVVSLSGGAAVFGGAGSPFNKLIGVGFDGPLDETALADAEAAFADRKTEIRAEVSSLADPSIVTRLSARGYALIGFEDVLGRRLDDLSRSRSRGSDPNGSDPTGSDPVIRVEEVEASGAPDWVRVVVDGFAVPDGQGVPSSESVPSDALESLMADMLAVPRYRRYLARIGGRAAGGATMRVDEGLAQLCGASTLPAFRRRGVQTALLHERLHGAAALGCDLAVVTTQPGSKSQQNAISRGFERLYTRAVMVR